MDDNELCLSCGFTFSDHERWEGTPPNYRTAIICPGGMDYFHSIPLQLAIKAGG